MKIRYKIWMENDGEVVFGKGRGELLRAIDDLHSLYAAAKKLKMSYRAAWGRLKASAARLELRLVQTDGRGKGMRLTEEAKLLLTRYDNLQRETEDFIMKEREAFSLQSLRNRQKTRTGNLPTP